MSSLISLDHRSGVPFYRQIIDQIMILISVGRLPAGARLPTVRRLAIELQVNPNTVARAYRELEIRQIVTTQRGTGTFVADAPDLARDEARHSARVEQFCEAVVADAGKLGLSLEDLVEALKDRLCDRR